MRYSKCFICPSVKLPGLILLAAAAASGLPLSVSYSEWLNFAPNAGAQISTDSSGSLYILTNAVSSGTGNAIFTNSVVTKLSPDGKTLVWQNNLAFIASAMTVDPAGGVYVTPVKQQTDTTLFVAKLNATGTGLAWKLAAGFLPLSTPALAADSQGRVYLAAEYVVNNYITETANVIRINAGGNAIDYTAKVNGIPTSIAVDPSGAVFVAGTETNSQGVNTGFLARVAPDGSAGYYALLPLGQTDRVATDAVGNVVIFGGGLLQRVDANGAVTLSTNTRGNTSFALDGAGNAYVTIATNGLFPVKNTLATCAFDPSVKPPSYSQLLSVYAPDGSLIQTTYIPGGDNLGSPLLAVTPNSTVLVAATAGPTFRPTQAGPFPAQQTGGMFLTSLTPNASAPTYSLACLANAASFGIASLAPGELVALFGNGLGPQQGISTQATATVPYPTSAGNVQVTFDGTPAPLLWVQDAQINAVAPWSLTPGQNTKVCVTYNNVTTNCLTWPVVQASPAVFTLDGLHAAALNQDGTINSANNPASPGSTISLFATGLGPLAPAQADGSLIETPLPANALAAVINVTASYTIGIPFGTPQNTPFPVSYAGPAPTLVAGISQINCQVKSFPSYGAIYLTVGSAGSPAFEVYIAGQ